MQVVLYGYIIIIDIVDMNLSSVCGLTTAYLQVIESL